MPAQHSCPVCKSDQTRKALKSEVVDQEGFKMSAEWKCEACGHLWCPALPRPLLIVGLVFGILLVAAGLPFLLLGGHFRTSGEQSGAFVSLFGGGGLIAMGGSAVWCCLRALLKRESNPPA